MNEYDIRVEALRLARNPSQSIADQIKTAKEFEAFLNGTYSITPAPTFSSKEPISE